MVNKHLLYCVLSLSAVSNPNANPNHSAAEAEARRRHSPWIPLQEQRQDGAAAHGGIPQWGRRAGAAATCGTVLEQLLKVGPMGQSHVEQCLESCGRGEPTQHQLGQDGIPQDGPTWSRAQWPGGAADWKCYRVTAVPVPVSQHAFGSQHSNLLAAGNKLQ